MNSPCFSNLVASRLEDIADQVYKLHSDGNFIESEMLKAEGLKLAECYDRGESFLYLSDLTGVAE